MSLEYVKSPGGLTRIASVVLGLIVVILGLFSHFKSAWLTADLIDHRIGYLKPYQLCEIPGIPSCPDISMERYFVSIIVICFILSTCSLIVSFFMDIGSAKLKFFDLGYHLIAASLLFTSAIVYLISANQINNIFILQGAPDSWNFRRSEKLAAGSLAIIQAILCGAIAFMVSRMDKLRGV